jgi:hypothetical protein
MSLDPLVDNPPSIAGPASLQERNWTFWLILLGAVCLLGGMFQELGHYDEGVIVDGALRVAHGEVPYRDFWAIYGPGQFYTLAAVFRTCGYSILSERIWDAAVRLGICLVTLAVSRRIVSRKAAYVSFIVVLLLLASYGNFAYPTIPAMFCTLLGVLLLVRSYPEGNLSGLFFSGVALGASTLYRHDTGVYGLFTAVVSILVSACWKSGTIRMGSGKMRGAWKALLVMGSGACAVIAPALLGLIIAVPIRDLRADFLDYPRIYAQARSFPLPPIIPRMFYLPQRSQLRPAYDWAIFYSPLAILGLSWIRTFGTLGHSPTTREDRGRSFTWMLLTLLGTLLAGQAVVRPMGPQMLPMTIPAIILAPALIADGFAGRRPQWVRGLTGVLVAFAAVIYIAGPAFEYARGLYEYAFWKKPATSLPRAGPFYVDADEGEAVRYIQANVPEGGAIFVGNVQHRQVYANDAIFYFLANRPAGTRYHDFLPGVITTDSVQQEVIRDLKRNRVQYIVLNSALSYALGFTEERHVRGATALDEYLRKNYRIVQVFGYYSVWRKDL